MIHKIISGGQTGVDQAGLDAAIACKVSHGGWLPAGRMTESGPLPSHYVMDELDDPSYPRRTRKNVEESDATLIISRGDLTGGSALTAKYATECGRPCLHIDLSGLEPHRATDKIGAWLEENDVGILNVAGPRGSSDGMIYEDVYRILVDLLCRPGVAVRPT